MGKIIGINSKKVFLKKLKNYIDSSISVSSIKITGRGRSGLSLESSGTDDVNLILDVDSNHYLPTIKDKNNWDEVSEGIGEKLNKEDVRVIEEMDSEDVKGIFYVPTIYYTTTNGNQISNTGTYLSSYIISHTNKNGKYEIVLKDTLTSIPNSCFISQHLLKTVIFNNLDYVTSIGDEFLYICSGLQLINLIGLSNVTSIGNHFLRSCTSLQSIDLSPLSKVESIDSNFLADCKSLQSIDLSPLSKVTSIGDEFLDSCTSLQSIDLSGLINIQNVNYAFLNYCTGLQSIDLSPLNNVTSIGNNFLNNCTSLQSIDLSPLNNVTSIGTYFLRNCTSLKNLIMPNNTKITVRGNNYLDGCNNLTTIYCPKGTLDFYKQLMPSRASIMVEMG